MHLLRMNEGDDTKKCFTRIGSHRPFGIIATQWDLDSMVDAHPTVVAPTRRWSHWLSSLRVLHVKQLSTAMITTYTCNQLQ
jgi:hypothetical protein